MVLIEIDDKVWEEFARSWRLLGVKGEEALVGMGEEARRIFRELKAGNRENIKRRER